VLPVALDVQNFYILFIHMTGIALGFCMFSALLTLVLHVNCQNKKQSCVFTYFFNQTIHNFNYSYSGWNFVALY